MPTATSPVSSRAGLLRAYFVLTVVLAALILVQAWTAGNAQYVGDVSFALHGAIGYMGTYLVAVAILVLAIVVRAPTAALIHAVALVALMTAQIGLGFMGRDMAAAASWHIFNGVLVFGIAVAQISQARALRKGQAAA